MMKTIRGRRQSIDSSFSALSTFRLSPSDSCCAERSQDRYETTCDSPRCRSPS